MFEHKQEQGFLLFLILTYFLTFNCIHTQQTYLCNYSWISFICISYLCMLNIVNQIGRSTSAIGCHYQPALTNKATYVCMTSFLCTETFSDLYQTIHLLTSKMFKSWLLSSSIKEIMQLFAKQLTCSVYGHLIQFPAIYIKHIFSKPSDLDQLGIRQSKFQYQLSGYSFSAAVLQSKPIMFDLNDLLVLLLVTRMNQGQQIHANSLHFIAPCLLWLPCVMLHLHIIYFSSRRFLVSII